MLNAMKEHHPARDAHLQVALVRATNGETTLSLVPCG